MQSPERPTQPYRIPRINPFVGRAGLDTIFSYGLRNPWRFSLDTRVKNDPVLMIGDVGEGLHSPLAAVAAAAP